MERLYVVENGRAAATGEPKMARALSAYNKHMSREMKAGKSFNQAVASWGGGSSSAAKNRAAARWSHNPPGQLLGMKIPAFIQDVNPLDGRNLKNVAALAGAAIVVVGAPMFAGSWNHGWTGLGLTALAAAAATGGAFMLSPAIAVPVGIASLAILGLRTAIQIVPRVVGWVVTPLLGWAGAAPPAASSGSAKGPAASYTNRQLEGYGRKQLQNTMPAAVAAGAAESHVASRNF